MSRPLYDFLQESFLFREDLLAEDFASVRPADLAAELRSYREHVLAQRAGIETEISAGGAALSIFFDTLTQPTPTVERLKQCAFYFDLVVADDPLFALSREPDPAAETPTELLGYSQPRLDPARVASAARFMRSLDRMVGADFLKFSPVSLLHEPSDGIPYRASGTLFSEELPPELHPFFAERARVRSTRQNEGGGWSDLPGRPLTPSRGILVGFDGLGLAYPFHLLASQVLATDEETRTALFANTLPDSPPTEGEFAAWVAQSKNQAAGRVLRAVLTDLASAASSNSFFCTDSPFVRDLLSARNVGADDIETDLANLALEFELPTLSGASTADLMDARQNDGEAFHNFRVALQRELRELRGISDPDDRRRRLEEVRHEFEVVKLNEVRTEFRKIQRSIAFEGAGGAASMAAVIASPQAGVLGLLAAAFAAGKTTLNYLNQVRSHPAYFLWRVSRRR